MSCTVCVEAAPTTVPATTTVDVAGVTATGKRGRRRGGGRGRFCLAVGPFPRARPAARTPGRGGLLFPRAPGRAPEPGFGAVVHALMHAGNVPRRLSGGRRARPFRHYALFGRAP